MEGGRGRVGGGRGDGRRLKGGGGRGRGEGEGRRGRGGEEGEGSKECERRMLTNGLPTQVDDVIEVTGPDVLTLCGQYGRVLQLNTAYVAGIGQACSPISQWGELGDYSEGEIELLRRLREGEEECGATATATATVASVAMVMTFALFTVFM